MTDEYGYPESPTFDENIPKKSNRTLIIILLIFILLCCCCSMIAVIAGGWTYGDYLLDYLSHLSETFLI